MTTPTNAQPKREPLYEHCDFRLYPDGTCTHKDRPISWHYNDVSKKPWIPAKRRTFVSLVKGMERDDEINYL